MDNITLIHPRSEFLIDDAVFPPLGLLYLAGHIRRCGGRAQVLDCALKHGQTDIQHDIVGIGFTTPQRHEAMELARQIRHERPHALLVAGGAHATHRPYDCLEHGFDRVVRGYGEEPLAAMLDLPNMPVELRPDRAALPLDQYIYEIDGRRATTMMTSRGCPFDCAFCARIAKGCQYFPADVVIREIRELSHAGWTAAMIFDDIFAANLRRLERIARGTEHLDMVFRCFSRADTLTPGHAYWLRRMGVVEVGIGIESGAEEVLRRNMKGCTPADNLSAVRLLHNHGIRVKGFLIVGLPGETPATLAATDVWLAEAQLDDVDFTVFQPMPGSPIYDDPEAYGLLDFNPEAIPHYKGRPGEYSAPYCYATLSAADLVEARDRLERTHKKWTP